MSAQSFLDGRVMLHPGDCRDVLAGLPDASIDSVVTDPPYALVSIGKRFGKADSARVVVPEGGSGAYARASAGFMGKAWDTGETAFAVEFWAQVLRVLKPGGHVVAFSGTRSYHRLACAIEDAGFEIRDQLAWAYGTGFPKNHDLAKALDKAAGVWRGRAKGAKGANGSMAGPNYVRTDKGDPITDEAALWNGWGTALKPAWEPIALARKALSGTVVQTALQHGTGALNIDGCRVGDQVRYAAFTSLAPCAGNALGAADTADLRRGTQGEAKRYEGRYPANILHDGSDEVAAAFGLYGDNPARFFYSAKADAEDRTGSKHPTVKPVDLMQWLCRLVTPPGGIVLDPFAGSGSTGEAAWREGFKAVLVEREPEYQSDIARRMKLAVEGPATRKAARAQAKAQAADHGPLFGDPGLAGGAAGLRPLRRSERTIGPIGMKR